MGEEIPPEKEYEGMGRTHNLDNPKFEKFVKKVVKDSKIRINKHIYTPIVDGWLIKIELEKFEKGRSMGTRWIKDYLSEEKKIAIEKLIDGIEVKYRPDTRDSTGNTQIAYPTKTIKQGRAITDTIEDIKFEELW